MDENKIIRGDLLAKKITLDIKKKCNLRIKNNKKIPSLAIINVGENPSSKIYIKNKLIACANVGFQSIEINLKKNVTETELLKKINEINTNKNINGLIIQLPLPKHINENTIIESINPIKDVDGFHPYNLGMLLQNKPIFRPCTAYGIIRLIESLNYNFEGKHAVLINRSIIVGKPLICELLIKNTTITICHSFTKNVKEIVRLADILITATGKANLIKGNWIKKDSIVIDVGISRINGKICGDVNFNEAIKNAKFITPSTKCVGPMTIAMLLNNTLLATNLQD